MRKKLGQRLQSRAPRSQLLFKEASMQHVAGEVLVTPRAETKAVQATVTDRKKIDPWLLAVPAIVVVVCTVIVSWVALALFLVRGTQWMGDSWHW